MEIWLCTNNLYKRRRKRIGSLRHAGLKERKLTRNVYKCFEQ